MPALAFRSGFLKPAAESGVPRPLGTAGQGRGRPVRSRYPALTFAVRARCGMTSVA